MSIGRTTELIGDDDAVAAAIAGGLLSVPVQRAERVAGGGRNSRVYRVDSPRGRFALKLYDPRPDDGRDGLACEAEALRLMADHGITCVPRVVAVDAAHRAALLTWIDGEPPATVTRADIEAAADFLDALHALRRTAEAEGLPLAAEACLSGAEIERQIHKRHARLAALGEDERELAAFLESSFSPLVDRALVYAKARMSAAGLDFAAQLPRASQSLVPADFGFHNSLRRPDGTLVFFDFEYFGWDDPVKLTADFLLHPGTALDAAVRSGFEAAARHRYGTDAAFGPRFDALLPLFGLRWVLILLNEFLPDRWDRRVRAGTSLDWDEAKRRQLVRARALFAGVSDELGTKTLRGPTPTGGHERDGRRPELDERSKHLRRLIVRGLAGGERGHIGASMSLVEILRVLYDDVLRYRPSEPGWPDRDRLILSKGHGCLALYAMLADKGFIPLETLDTFCRRDSILGGHPEAGKVPGIEASTGSLGHGLSYGVGMALAARMRRRVSRVFVVMGDGEINEGSVWEAAMCAGKYRLAHLTVVIDYNKIQSAGFTRDIQDLEPLLDKWRAFGFAAIEVDGHDVAALRAVFTRVPFAADRPTAVICHTVKGRGIGFAENDPGWHHKAKLGPDDLSRLRAALA
jgi:transketolase